MWYKFEQIKATILLFHVFVIIVIIIIIISDIVCQPIKSLIHFTQWLWNGPFSEQTGAIKLHVWKTNNNRPDSPNHCISATYHQTPPACLVPLSSAITVQTHNALWTALFSLTTCLRFHWSREDAATCDWRKVSLPVHTPPLPRRYSWFGATVVPVVFTSLTNKETQSCCLARLRAQGDEHLTLDCTSRRERREETQSRDTLGFQEEHQLGESLEFLSFFKRL